MSPPPAELFASRVLLGPALRVQPDRRLVDLVRDGYDAAFEEIVRRYRRPLDRFAAAIVGGRSEDVTQDAFSKALLALRGSEAEIELRPWLYRIVRNTALNDLRDRAPAADELTELLPGGRSAAAEAEVREELRDLMGRLQALPEPQRAALVMRELEGLSHEEIAAALGVSGGAARQAIYRARAALREGFALLMPLPAFRLLATHGPELVKAGAATVLIAGTVGAGVAIEHHRGGRGGPEAAQAAPLVAGKRAGAGSNRASEPSTNSDETGDHGSTGGTEEGGDSSHRREHGNGGFLEDGSPSASNGGPGPSSDGSESEGGSGLSGSDEDGSHRSGSGDSGSGSTSDERSGSNSGPGGDDGSSVGGNSGPGSTDSPDSNSPPAGGDDSEDSAARQSPESETGPAGSALESGESVASGDDGGSSSSSDSGTSGSGSGDLSTSSSGSDGGS
ncbi:MAG TPA: RNA polymerase sigma factor [Solirubrobacterales bacterium]|nr:RNA polymerase sigma factor [Solirubrobacterales bacterium]